MSLEKVRAELRRRFPKHLAETRKMLRQPSVSATGEGIRETAEMLREWLDRAGARTRFFGRSGHPVVYGEFDVGAKTTLVTYDMYDVQPVGDLDAWISPPFSAEIRRVRRVGDCVFARGATNSKGPLAGSLLTWETIRDVDELPVNLKCIIEGEEETSSRNFIKFVAQERSRLQADAAFSNDYAQDLSGTPSITLGVKGCLYFTLRSRAGKRGGPRRSEIHSSAAAVLPSPAWHLVQGLASLVDEHEFPAIDGLLDDIRPPDARARKLVRALAKRFNRRLFLEEHDTDRLKYEGGPQQILERYSFDPTVNICGIHGGFTEPEGTKTVMPHDLFAKVDIRLVPDMTARAALAKVRAHLRRRGFGDLEIIPADSYGASRADPNSWIVKTEIATTRKFGYDPLIWPTSTGTAPFFVFDEVLRLPWASGGLGHGNRSHAPNEYASVRGMAEFEQYQAAFVYEAARRALRRKKR